jgi:hypothetical protein
MTQLILSKWNRLKFLAIEVSNVFDLSGRTVSNRHRMLEPPTAYDGMRDAFAATGRHIDDASRRFRSDMKKDQLDLFE